MDMAETTADATMLWFVVRDDGRISRSVFCRLLSTFDEAA